jgi:hypothetical protein
LGDLFQEIKSFFLKNNKQKLKDKKLFSKKNPIITNFASLSPDKAVICSKIDSLSDLRAFISSSFAVILTSNSVFSFNYKKKQ